MSAPQKHKGHSHAFGSWARWRRGGAGNVPLSYYGIGCAAVVILLLVAIIATIASSAALNKKERFSNEPIYEALHAAQAQWAQQAIAHYQLDVTLIEARPFTMCSYSVEIRHEEVVATTTNTCSSKPLTISALYGWIQNHLDHYDGTCGLNGCRCDGPIGLDVVFDPQYGYPYYATFQEMGQFASQYRSFIDDIPWFAHVCTAMGTVYPQLETVQVTALR